MTKAIDWLYRKLTGKNSKFTTADVILNQMNEPRPLPLGRTEFNMWAERIMSGALVKADRESQLFVLSSAILSLGPTEDHKPDAYFIHLLRKAAANEVAHHMFVEIKEAQAKKKAEQEGLKLVKEALDGSKGSVLDDK